MEVPEIEVGAERAAHPRDRRARAELMCRLGADQDIPGAQLRHPQTHRLVLNVQEAMEHAAAHRTQSVHPAAARQAKGPRRPHLHADLDRHSPEAPGPMVGSGRTWTM